MTTLSADEVNPGLAEGLSDRSCDGAAIHREFTCGGVTAADLELERAIESVAETEA